MAENKRIPSEQLQKALISSIGEHDLYKEIKFMIFLGDRLMDKSLMCRKSAFRFMLEFIESNPYGHDVRFKFFYFNLMFSNLV